MPLHDLLVRVVGRIGTERRVADEAFEHNGAQRPPITLVPIPLLIKYLWGNIIRRTNGRICLKEDSKKGETQVEVTDQFPSVGFPCSNLVFVCHCQVD